MSSSFPCLSTELSDTPLISNATKVHPINAGIFEKFYCPRSCFWKIFNNNIKKKSTGLIASRGSNIWTFSSLHNTAFMMHDYELEGTWGRVQAWVQTLLVSCFLTRAHSEHRWAWALWSQSNIFSLWLNTLVKNTNQTVFHVRMNNRKESLINVTLVVCHIK